MGRLFDVVAALLGVRSEVSYEGQAAIELEAITADGITSHYEIDAVALAPQPILRGVIDDLRAGVARPVIAAKFHNTVVHIITQVSLALRAQHNLNTVALSGGVFQNVRLLCDAVVALQQHQFDVLVHEHIPPNDGGLALGQASIGNFIRKEQ